MSLQIKKDYNYVDQFQQKTEDPSSLASWEAFQQSYQIAETFKIDSFNDLISLKLLPHLDLLPHQKECAETVIQKMNGRALLADEVGLGKTIEAGVILKEYLVRGLVKKVLILVPASLVTQWASELNQKFLISAFPAGKRVDWEHTDILITTLDTAKSERHRSTILDHDFDLVFLDEAY